MAIETSGGEFMLTLTVNGQKRQVASPPDTPLLYVLRDELGIMSPKFGCGLAQCGACSVLLDGTEIRSCVTAVAAIADTPSEITTVEGLPARWAHQRGQPVTENLLHPVQEAWVEQQVPQCGYCQYGMMIKATELLEHNATPSEDEIKAAFTTSGPSAHLCRCGSYAAILEGVRHAASLMATTKSFV
jgi:isoquinoline 1-oxidoreductase alpha subunit